MKNSRFKFRAWHQEKKKMVFGSTNDKPSASWILAAEPLFSDPIMQLGG